MRVGVEEGMDYLNDQQSSKGDNPHSAANSKKNSWPNRAIMRKTEFIIV
jgi:hypothetical protein